MMPNQNSYKGTVAEAKEIHRGINLDPKTEKGRQILNEEFNKMQDNLDDQIDVEAKLRKSGLHHTTAKDLLILMKEKPVGQIVRALGETWVKTPFNTVVRTQQYVDALQDRLYEQTTVENEKLIERLREIAQNSRTQSLYLIKKYEMSSALDLFKLFIKRLFKRG